MRARVVAVALGLVARAGAARRAVPRPRPRGGRRPARPGCRPRRRTRRGARRLAHEAGLQRAGHGVETGVQDRGVGLRRAVADVVRRPRPGRCAGGWRASSRAMAVPTTPAPTTVDVVRVLRVLRRRSSATADASVPVTVTRAPAALSTAVRKPARRSAASVGADPRFVHGGGPPLRERVPATVSRGSSAEPWPRRRRRARSRRAARTPRPGVAAGPPGSA